MINLPSQVSTSVQKCCQKWEKRNISGKEARKQDKIGKAGKYEK